MNWLDLVIIVLLIIFTISGLASGFIRSAFALAGVILGVILASHFDNWATFISNVNTARNSLRQWFALSRGRTEKSRRNPGHRAQSL